MLLTMKSMCKNTFFFEKRPKHFQKKSGTMFLRPDVNLFWKFSKKKIIRHKRCPQNNHSNIFFGKNFCQKNLPTKLVKKTCEKKLENQLFFTKKNLKMVILSVKLNRRYF